MPITVDVDVAPQVLTIGETDEVLARYEHGLWRAEYRGQSLTSTRLIGLRAECEDLRAKQVGSMARARKLRAAEKNPVPAVRASTLEDVGVRGIDKRSGYLLIIDSHGERTSVRPGDLLRPLTTDERATLDKLRRAALDEAQAITKAPQPQKVGDLVKILDFTVPTRYDFKTDELVGEYRGKTYRGANETALRRAIETDIVLSDRPWMLDSPSRVISADEWRQRPGVTLADYGRMYGVFSDKSDADAYIAAKERFNVARNALDATLKEYAFDASEFKDE